MVGYLDAGSGHHPDGGLPLLGALRELPELADELQVREVVVGKDVLQTQATLEQLVSCRNLGIKVTPAATLYEELTGQVPLSQIDHYWIMDLPNRALLNRPYTALKRLVDIVLSLLGLIVLILLGPFVAVAIWIDSGRPIFYTQLRTGLHGRQFRCSNSERCAGMPRLVTRPGGRSPATSGSPAWAASCGGCGSTSFPRC